jgi:hypothetical protein
MNEIWFQATVQACQPQQSSRVLPRRKSAAIECHFLEFNSRIGKSTYVLVGVADSDDPPAECY